MDETIYGTLGTNHMNVEHNTLFSTIEIIGAPALEMMQTGGPTAGSLGASGAISVLGSGSLTIPFDISTDSSTAERRAFGNSLWLESSNMVTEDPADATMGSEAASLGASTTYVAGSAAGGALIIIFLNDQPNSCVEKNAANIFNSLHGERNKTYTFPAIISESPEGYETIYKLFGSGSLDKAKETLDIWEKIIEEYV